MTEEPDEMQHKLDEVEEDIRKARREADELEHHDEPRFYESGNRPDLDDQTIAPPG